MNRLLKKLDEDGKAGIDNLKSLYRKLALSLHPDRSRKGPEAFLRLRKEYEEALRQLSQRRPSGSRPKGLTPFYRALEAYLENIDTDNIILSLASNPAIGKLDELLEAAADRKDLSDLFSDVRKAFHLNFDGVLRYPPVRTAFIRAIIAMWELVLFRKFGDRFNSDNCETCLEEAEHGFRTRTGKINSTVKNEISVIGRIIDFVRKELYQLRDDLRSGLTPDKVKGKS